jgi:hypothetical protein
MGDLELSSDVEMDIQHNANLKIFFYEGSMSQATECLLCKFEVLSANSSPTKKQTNKKYFSKKCIIFLIVIVDVK